MFITASKDNTAKVRHPHYRVNVTVIQIFLPFNVKLCNCFSSALWFQFSGTHQDFQDREARQLCCHLSHFGSRKWSFINGSLWGRQIHMNPWIWPIITAPLQKTQVTHISHFLICSCENVNFTKKNYAENPASQLCSPWKGLEKLNLQQKQWNTEVIKHLHQTLGEHFKKQMVLFL